MLIPMQCFWHTLANILLSVKGKLILSGIDYSGFKKRKRHFIVGRILRFT